MIAPIFCTVFTMPRPAAFNLGQFAAGRATAPPTERMRSIMRRRTFISALPTGAITAGAGLVTGPERALASALPAAAATPAAGTTKSSFDTCPGTAVSTATGPFGGDPAAWAAAAAGWDDGLAHPIIYTPKPGEGLERGLVMSGGGACMIRFYAG